MRGLLLLPLLAAPLQAQFWARLANPQVRLTLAHPPDLGLPPRPVAVVPVDIPAREVAEAIRAELAGGGARMVDPGTVAWACAGENLDQPDSAALERLRRRLGDVQLLLVAVTRAEVRQGRSSHGGKENGKPVTFQVAETRLAFAGRLQAADLATGRLLPAAGFSQEPHATAESPQAPPPFPDAAPLRAQAYGAVRAQASRLFLPWNETLEETCFNDDAYGLDKVHGRIKAGDLDGAWDLAQAAAQAARADVQKDPKGEPKYRARAVYDLGLVAWLRGRPAEAQPLFRESLGILPDASIVQDALKDAIRAQTVAEALAAWRDQAAPAQAPPDSPAPEKDPSPATDPEARLKALKRLHDQGLISDQDYARKKADILKGL